MLPLRRYAVSCFSPEGATETALATSAAPLGLGTSSARQLQGLGCAPPLATIGRFFGAAGKNASVAAKPFHRRSGFTLLELLIALVIIAMLVTMLLAGIGAVKGRMRVVEARDEIGQLGGSLAQFRFDHNNVKYVPSRILLCMRKSEYASYTADPALATSSLDFLLRAFGNRLWYNPTTQTDDGTIQWDGGQSGTSGPWVLNGDQALVFWVGGIPGTGGALLGFSGDPTNPANLSSGVRKGPYFNFKTERLSQTGNAAGFYRYIDPHGNDMPYVYFSSYKTGNDYNNLDAPLDSGGNPLVRPYFQVNGSTPVKWINPNDFQIICAGRDGIFGNQTTAQTAGAITFYNYYDPASGITDNRPAFDDQANFARSLLGAASD